MCLICTHRLEQLAGTCVAPTIRLIISTKWRQMGSAFWCAAFRAASSKRSRSIELAKTETSYESHILQYTGKNIQKQRHPKQWKRSVLPNVQPKDENYNIHGLFARPAQLFGWMPYFQCSEVLNSATRIILQRQKVQELCAKKDW